MSTVNITAKDFEDKVLKSDKYALIDFWATWCMPCQMMVPVLEELSDDADLKEKLVIGKVNTEETENQMLAFNYNIRSIPNMKLFKDGKVVAEFIGFRSKEQLKEELLNEINKLTK
jgi:thioredoxin 1